MFDKKENSKENNSQQLFEYQKKLRHSQRYVSIIKTIEFISATVLLLLVFGSLYHILDLQISAKNPDMQKLAENLNTFTGIVLGFVAMAVSLLGMFLSFHNTMRTEQSNMDTLREFTKLAETLKDIEHIDSELASSLGELKSMVKEIEDYKTELTAIEKRLDSILDNLGEIGISIERLSPENAGKKELSDKETDENPKTPPTS